MVQETWPCTWEGSRKKKEQCTKKPKAMMCDMWPCMINGWEKI